MRRREGLPACFGDASWRATTPVDPAAGVVGLAFSLADGSVARMAISVDDARHVLETLQTSLERYRSGVTPGVQSDRSSGTPQSAGLPSEGQ